MEYWLNYQNKTCSDGDIKTVIKIFQKCGNGIPATAGYRDYNGNTDLTCRSCGFYIGLLALEKHETDPKLFFEILEIDQKIGWTNPDHVEFQIFFHNGIKIIEDQRVSLKKFNFPTENKILELVKMA